MWIWNMQPGVPDGRPNRCRLPFHVFSVSKHVHVLGAPCSVLNQVSLDIYGLRVFHWKSCPKISLALAWKAMSKPPRCFFRPVNFEADWISLRRHSGAVKSNSVCTACLDIMYLI